MKKFLDYIASSDETMQPNAVVHSFTNLNTKFLEDNGIRHLIIDLDQTMVVQGGSTIPRDLLATLEELSDFLGEGTICFLTNEPNKEREILITEETGIKVVSGEFRKPDRQAYEEALKCLEVKPAKSVAMIGDRVWTDIIGANRLGLYTIQVKPLSPQKDSLAVSLLRRLELLSQRSGFGSLLQLALVLMTLSGVGLFQVISFLRRLPTQGLEVFTLSSGGALVIHLVFVLSSTVYYVMVTNEKAKLLGGNLKTPIWLFNTYPAFVRITLSGALLAVSFVDKYVADLGPGIPDNLLGIAMFYGFIAQVSLLVSLSSYYHTTASRFVRVAADIVIIVVIALSADELRPFALALMILPVGTAARYFRWVPTVITLIACIAVAIMAAVSSPGLATISAIVSFFLIATVLILKVEYSESVAPIDSAVKMHYGTPGICTDILEMLKACTKVMNCASVFYIRDISTGYFYSSGAAEDYGELTPTASEEMFNFIQSHSDRILKEYDLDESQLEQQQILVNEIERVMRPPAVGGVTSILISAIPHSASGYLMAINNLTRNGVVRRRFSPRHARTLLLFSMLVRYFEKIRETRERQEKRK